MSAEAQPSRSGRSYCSLVAVGILRASDNPSSGASQETNLPTARLQRLADLEAGRVLLNEAGLDQVAGAMQRGDRLARPGSSLNP